MLQSVTIENFKSFERATLPLAPLTLLIGANASGKSNAIEAMQLLAWLASGPSLSRDLLYAIREEELSLRGELNSLTRTGGEFTIGCHVTGDSEQPLTYLISVGVNEEGIEIDSERLSEGAKQLIEIKKSLLLAPPFGTALIALAEVSQIPGYNFPDGMKPAVHAALRVRKTLSSTVFLEASTRRMREYSFLQEKQLNRDGSALSSVLRHLTHDNSNKDEILRMIRSVPEQDIVDISYIQTPRNEVMVQLHESFGGKVVPREAALLSDGTLRVLAVAAALFSVEEGSVVVIEEIDNGVHPSRAEHLLSQIQKVARERNLRVLLTTHNPALLDALPLDAVPDVVACYRDPEKGDSRLVRLQDLESYSELIAQGPLGHLLTQGIVDRYLKSPEKRDRSKKVERDLAWIDELRRQA